MMENGESAKEDSSLLYKSMLNTTLGLGDFNQYSYLFEDEDDGDDDSLLASPSSENGSDFIDQIEKGTENGNTPVSVPEAKNLSQITNRNQQLQSDWENQQKQTQQLEEKLAHAKIQVSQKESQWKQERERWLSPSSKLAKRRNQDKDPVMLLQLEREKRMEIEVQFNALKQQQAKQSNLMSPMRLDTLKRIKKAHMTEIEELHRYVDTIQAQHKQEKEELEKTIRLAQKETQTSQKERKDLKTTLLKEQETNSRMKGDHELESKRLHHRIDLLESQKAKVEEGFLQEQKLKKVLEGELQCLGEECHEQQQMAEESLARSHDLETRQQEERMKLWEEQMQQLQAKHDSEQRVLNELIETQRCQINELKENYGQNEQEGQENAAQQLCEHVQHIESEHAQEIQDLRHRLEDEKDMPVDWSADFEISHVDASPPFKQHKTSTVAEHAICLSPIFPSKSSKEPQLGSGDDDDDKMLNELMDEVGQMDREREELLKEMAEDVVGEINVSSEGEAVDELGKSRISADANSSKTLDQTLTLLTNLKDLMGCQGEDNEKESSVLEQLAVLSEMMQRESGAEDTLDALSQTEISKSQLILFQNDEPVNSSFLSRSKKTSFSRSEAQENPWRELVEELRRKIEFLEHDRSEIARISDEMVQRQRDSQKLEVEAAVATAKRVSLEQLRLVQLDTREQTKTLYNALCRNCQQRVYVRN